jgi:hypothetical protein
MTQGSHTSSVPTIVILGTDLLLAARPATPVQLAHACLAAGYGAAIPVSWGDELLATSIASRAVECANEPAIACACPYVRDRFIGSELERFLLSVASPPVACARYVRALYGGAVHVTYVGVCPAAEDASIDARYAPGEFLARLRDLGIDVAEQPVVFESVIPPDRRRYESLPGGAPTNDALQRAGASLSLVELEGEDYVIALAQRLLERETVLVDVAPRLGCACAGGSSEGPMRAAVIAMEPPRARTSVVESSVDVDLSPPPRTAPRPQPHEPPVEVAAVAPAHPAPVEQPPERAAIDETVAQPQTELSPRRRTPTRSHPRLGLSTPTSRTQEGRVVPRAYLRRRRTSGETLQLPESGEAAGTAGGAHDRQAEIVRHVEPAIEPPPPPVPPPATIPVAEPATPLVKPRDAEPSPPKLVIPTQTMTDLVPPPPIMVDVHPGDELVVADSLSELMGIEAAATRSVTPPEPSPPVLREAQRQAPASPPTPSHRAAPRPTPWHVHLPPAISSTSRREPARETHPADATPPAESRITEDSYDASAAPIAPTLATPRRSQRVRNAVLLPRRRRGTAAILWMLFAAVVTLAGLSLRMLIDGGRFATAGTSTPPAPVASDTIRDTMPLRLAPIIVDSIPAAAESVATVIPPVDSTAGASTGAPPPSSPAVSRRRARGSVPSPLTPTTPRRRARRPRVIPPTVPGDSARAPRPPADTVRSPETPPDPR